MPSATTIIARRIGQATRGGKDVLLAGVTMGGGPCSWAAEAHLKAGHKVYATPDAARTFDDHLENVERTGIRVVSEDEAKGLAKKEGVACIELKDLYVDAIEQSLEAFGVEPAYDGVAVAVFDHGAAPVDVSDRTFRFDHLRRAVEQDDSLLSFGYLASEVPPYLTRMRSVVRTYPARLDAPLFLLDTAPAGALGALGDTLVRSHQERLLVNLGNMHTTAFHLQGDRIVGLFEHHTGLIDQGRLNTLLERLVAGTLSNSDVFDDHGHGAHIFASNSAAPFLAVTGPQRALLRGSPLQPHFAVPHGDMMLSGCFGLVRGFAGKVPQWREAIERALES